MKLKKQLYAEIAKVEDQDDGTLKVWGYASSGSKDADGETITPEAMKAALPDYMKFGAVREMHQPSAAGTAIEAEVQEDGKTWFGAHIVDPVAITKVKTQVYKGFSIGGKVTQRDTLNKSIINGLNLIEVSLVDRPCNPDAVMTVFKAERSPEDDVNELAELLDNGMVTPAEVIALVKAAKQDSEPAADPVVDEPVVKAEVIEKGMYSVCRFAELMASLAYLCEDATWEAEYEGDNSPLPAALKDWVVSGLALFQAMAQEEAQELVATLQAAVAKGVATTPLQKRLQTGQTDTDGIDAAPDVLKGAVAQLETLLASLKGVSSTEEQSDHEDQVSKASAVNNDPHSEAIAKALAPVNAELQKVSQEKDELQKQFDALRNQPAPGKALLKVLSKEADVLPDVTQVQKAEDIPPEGTEARAMYELKKVFQAGGVNT